MQIIINNKEFDVGWKSYIAWCSNLYKNGMIDRYETNKQLLTIKIDKDFVASFLAKYFNTDQARSLYNVLTLTSYQFLYELLTTPVSLGMLCLYVSRSNDIPTKHAQFKRNRTKWLYKLIEESIQYPIEDKLSQSYLSNVEGNLTHYISLAKFCPTEVIHNFDVAKEFNIDINELNSIDECGWLIRIDENNFKWSTNNIKEYLCNYDYRNYTWAIYNKLIRNINKQRFN